MGFLVPDVKASPAPQLPPRPPPEPTRADASVSLAGQRAFRSLTAGGLAQRGATSLIGSALTGQRNRDRRRTLIGGGT